MRRLDDEILMAYVDGALSDLDARHVEAELARDANARRMVTLFRSTAALARHAYDLPMWSEPPRRLALAIENSRPFRHRLHAWPGWTMGWHTVGGLVAAASLAALVVVGSTLWLLGSHRHNAVAPTASTASIAVGAVAADSQLARVLDGFANRSIGPVDRRFFLAATLADKWGNTCQEVDAHAEAPDGPPALAFVACRPAGGDWTVVGAVSPLIITHGQRRQAYVRSAAAAHEALSSVLNMIGASQRASSLKPETKQQ